MFGGPPFRVPLNLVQTTATELRGGPRNGPPPKTNYLFVIVALFPSSFVKVTVNFSL